MYDISALYEAHTVEEAISLLVAHPGAVIIAGGSDVLIKLREGKLSGCELVSIRKIDSLQGIDTEPDGTLKILPLTSFSHITKSPIIQQFIPVLGEAVNQVGGPQIRNIGTIGGNISNGVTSADSASTLLSYDAEVEITGPGGVRTVSLESFYLAAGKVDLKPAELVTAIRIRPESYYHCFGHYIKYAMRNAMDIATIGCSINVVLSQDKSCFKRVRIAYGVAGPVPMRCREAESALVGLPVSKAALDLLADEVTKEVHPRTSWRATADFRMQIIRETAKRALTESIKRAGGDL